MSAALSPWFPRTPYLLTPGRKDPFCPGEWCRKCHGSGVFTIDGFDFDPCFCCAGKGRRSEWDHSVCMSYAYRHQFGGYCCSEFIGVVALTQSA